MIHAIHGQPKITGKIIESDNHTLLKNVEIINLNTQERIISKLNGSFEILKEGTFSFNKHGYASKTIELKFDKFYIIQLKLNPSELNKIIVNASHIPKTLKKATTSINIITLKNIERSNTINFASVLNRTPGIFMQTGSLNTNRITIRGIGSRNLFGTSKIKAYFKDIPLTTGSGETNIEDFELDAISSIEISKGAVSSIFGAGLGGVIQLKPKHAALNKTSINSGLTLGSFGLIKNTLNVNHGTQKNSFNAIYSNTYSDGYRENNNYNRQTFTWHSNHFINPKNELTLLLSYVDLKAYIPSSINETTFLNNPKSAAFTWANSKGHENTKRGILGLSWDHEYHNKLKQISSVYTTFRNTFEPRPFNILQENEFAIGLRTRFLGHLKILNKTLKYTFGGELFQDSNSYQTYENLYEIFPSGTGSVQGEQLSNFKEKRNYYNFFAETNIETSNRTTISLGINLNKTMYRLEDRYPISSENPNQSGSYNYKNIISPKLGISHIILEKISLYSSISHGFSPISLNETLLPDGQINTNLKPETGWNFELGTRGTAVKNKIQFSASIYRLNIKNLIVSRRTAQDQFIGINAGKTENNGLELELNYHWLQKKSINISSFFNYTLNNYVFKEFIDDTNNFSGNDLTGVPRTIFNAGIDFNFTNGIYGNINHQIVGSMPITDSNSLYSDSYNLSNIKIGYQSNLSKALQLNIYFGLDNILNSKYASQILINASGFGGTLPRYYYPGNPINYYAGVHINYNF